jgi:TPR repeat protein
MYARSKTAYRSLATAVNDGVVLKSDILSKGFVPKNFNKSIEYFQKAYDKNYALNCYDLESIYSAKDFKKTKIYIQKACKLGNVWACAEMDNHASQ